VARHNAVEARFDLPPEEAMRFFRRKGLRTSFSWKDVWTVEHEAAFTVAKMADVDLLADVRDAVDQAIAEGQTLAQFKEAIIPRLVKAGWWGVREQVDPVTQRRELVQLGSPRRLQTIFRTNLMTAYSAGEWAQIAETAEDAPFLMYDAVDDNRTREQHRAWNGVALRWDDPWWRTHRPPNGWNCRCSVIQLSGDDLQAMGKTPDKAPPVKRREWVNKRTGEVMQVPLGIDPGWDYNPGAERQSHLDKALADKQAALRGE
jgi:SPP1 gp7 family putative phage head morphogenesis protein